MWRQKRESDTHIRCNIYMWRQNANEVRERIAKEHACDRVRARQSARRGVLILFCIVFVVVVVVVGRSRIQQPKPLNGYHIHTCAWGSTCVRTQCAMCIMEGWQPHIYHVHVYKKHKKHKKKPKAYVLNAVKGRSVHTIKKRPPSRHSMETFTWKKMKR